MAAEAGHENLASSLWPSKASPLTAILTGSLWSEQIEELSAWLVSKDLGRRCDMADTAKGRSTSSCVQTLLHRA